ncbi:MAG: DNA-binding protein [Rhodomicrobium sp.]
MTAHLLRFAGLSSRDRGKVRALPKAAEGGRLELRVLRPGAEPEAISLPHDAAELIGAVLEHLARGERIAILAEDAEVSPNDAAAILGLSRPLVVHRMEAGDLAFRYVGKHRRAKLKDVLALKEKLDRQSALFDALAEETESLMHDHGL